MKSTFARADSTYAGELKRDWSALAESSEYAIETCNQLHVLEAYSQLYQVRPSIMLKTQMTAIIDQFLERIFPARDHLVLGFHENWQVANVSHSYGHNFEAPWLVAYACKILGDEVRLNRAMKAMVQLVDATLQSGRHLSGSVYSTRDHQGQLCEQLSCFRRKHPMHCCGFVNTQVSDNT